MKLLKKTLLEIYDWLLLNKPIIVGDKKYLFNACITIEEFNTLLAKIRNTIYINYTSINSHLLEHFECNILPDREYDIFHKIYIVRDIVPVDAFLSQINENLLNSLKGDSLWKRII